MEATRSEKKKKGETKTNRSPFSRCQKSEKTSLYLTLIGGKSKKKKKSWGGITEGKKVVENCRKAHAHEFPRLLNIKRAKVHTRGFVYSRSMTSPSTRTSVRVSVGSRNVFKIVFTPVRFPFLTGIFVRKKEKFRP